MKQQVVQKAPEQNKKPTPNLTGIPTQMKLDFERRSGLSFDDVRVHYNSDKPRKIGALAYTQIPQVHIGPGQERHLRHELGHVVQQKQGIVRPTTWINGLPVNDSPAFEHNPDTSFTSYCVYKYAPQKKPAIMPLQCKLKAEVQIVPDKSATDNYAANDLQIISFNLLGRAATGLTKKNRGSGKRQSTQGDHTVADILFKEYQRDLISGKKLDSAILVYKILFNRLTNLVARINKIAVAPVTPQARAGTQPVKVKKVKSAKKRGRSVVDTDGSIAVMADRLRLDHASQSIRDGEAAINSVSATTAARIIQWVELFRNIVCYYNDAYAHLPMATTGTGTGGDGEGGHIETVRNWQGNHTDDGKRNLVDQHNLARVRMSAVNGLIDMNSAGNVVLAREATLDAGYASQFAEKCQSILSDLSMGLKSAGLIQTRQQKYGIGTASHAINAAAGGGAPILTPVIFYVEMLSSYLRNQVPPAPGMVAPTPAQVSSVSGQTGTGASGTTTSATIANSSGIVVDGPVFPSQVELDKMIKVLLSSPK